MTRILIADDHAVVRIGLRQILQTRSGWEVVGEAADGLEAVNQTLLHKPDVVVLDYSLPVMNGIEATAKILKALPKTRILAFTMHDCETILTQLLQEGVQGYLLKTEADQYLIEAVKYVASGRYFFSSTISDHIRERFLKAPRDSLSVLTDRERDVVRLIALGNKNKDVAEALGISIKTVETHRAAVMRKLNMPSSASLVRYAVRNKIVSA
ncbi:MAG: response regulator transcription factor [Hyphomicrobium sp.]|jgi:DNA-binding NarL/FixJ family response regulator|uniref:response regulator n=1 Tax=Hyphomicrobium sp. CS1BSMeth3 TaxID=1892844 RepID=UPI00086A6562|nr:response regulator transcription factor [Hyphomicrobium sp. CS1BSMeth3]MBN9265568.1 response regulator transcription factor [Hyphomicrobium sp.]MBN9280629.1 response regulator transcription factor [Hyphomicrobium sp.]ODT22722.1 MAG: DNA-binding response regulator [Hyphomicrobium sp. SCN 65-11]